MRTRGGGGARLLIALIVVVMSVVGYCSQSTTNPITGEKQHVAGITPGQEIALGLQAAPQMAQEYGGESDDSRATERVSAIGQRVVQRSEAGKTPYRFDFHLLGDRKTINAFALPGGQVFVTEALYRRLRTDGELAGVLGHEVGHVIARHGAEHIAKQQLTQGITGAAVLATYDPDNPSSASKAQLAQLAISLVSLKFGRDDELEADKLGIRLIADAGYDPHAMVGVMEVLQKAAGSGRQPEFFSTHPNPENRVAKIKAAIEREFPQGVPDGLEK